MHGSLMPALRILALGPNPALQRVLTFDAPIVPGGVNRATSVSTYVGGKGQGVALAVHRWAPGAAVCAQFVGGDHGCIVEAQLAAQGVECVSEHVSAETRQCTTLIGAGGSTELIDPSGSVSEAEVTRLLTLLSSRAWREIGEVDAIGGVALCGTTPPGAEQLYARFCEMAASRPTLLLLDGYKGVEQVWLIYIDLLR